MPRNLHGKGGEEALLPALDLERHAPRALTTGLVLAFLLHGTIVAYGNLMPPLPRGVAPPPQKPIEVDLVAAAPPPVTVLPYDLEETTIAVPPPVRIAYHPAAAAPPSPAPPPSPPPSPPPPEPAKVAEAPVPAATTTTMSASVPVPPPSLRPRGPDRSAPARLGGNVLWKCPFPAEADPEMRHVIVRAQADVRPDGSAAEVAILQDPGYGFGKAARLCALKHTYVPARGPDGAPAQGFTLPFGVHFDK